MGFETVVTAIIQGLVGHHRKNKPWIYGCCWAVRRQLYLELGGHRAIRQKVAEDVAFARLAAGKNVELKIIDARDIVAVDAVKTVRDYFYFSARILLDYSLAARAAALMLIAVLIYAPPLALLAAPYTVKPIAFAALVLELAAYASAARLNNYPLHSIAFALPAAMLFVAGVLQALRGYTIWACRKIQPIDSRLIVREHCSCINSQEEVG